MTDAPAAAQPRRFARALRRLAAVLALVAALGVAALVALDSDAGRRLVADRLARMETASGLSVRIGRIDGSLFGRMVLRDVAVRDPQGVFANAPDIRLDWRPLAYLGGHIDLRDLSAPLVVVARRPALRPVPADPDRPVLPDIDLTLGRLAVERLVLAPAVTGRAQTLRLSGRARIADARALVAADLAALNGGDRAMLRLDAAPDAGRLVMAASVRAPAGGALAALVGLKAPLALDLAGRGDWRAWDGRLIAVHGGRSLARLALTARNGLFRAQGPTRPGLIVPALARLTGPALAMDLSAQLADRRADVQLKLASAALAVSARGDVDLARNRIGMATLSADLMRPAMLAPNLAGSGVRLRARIDGPFARPRIDYRLNAAMLGFGDTRVEGLAAGGAARITPGRILIPLRARAARITGLGPSLGDLLTGVTLDGQIAVSGVRLLADDLRIRAPRIDARAVIAADLAAGTYRGALSGRVDRYLVQGAGLFDLSSDIDLVAPRGGGWALAGRFAARSVRIDNGALRDLLAGQTLITGRIGYGPTGVATLDRLRVASPGLTVTDGAGRLWPDGRIDGRAAGIAGRYGPVSVALSGTLARPVIRLTAARPRLGIPLTDVEAVVRGTAAGYEVSATGGSSYGPFAADLLVVTGQGPLRIDVRRGRFAELDLSGALVQTGAGPFAGTLAVSGNGVSGQAVLGGEGDVQTARLSATARDARLPSDPPVMIGRALIAADIALYPDAPRIIADVQAAAVTRGELRLRRARGRIDLRGGRGRAALVAEGDAGMAFRLAANAALSPGIIRLAADGELGGIALRLAAPAVIRTIGDDYLLDEARVIAGSGGELRVAGRLDGDGGMAVDARFDRFDLAVLGAVSGGLGIGGRATGRLSFADTGDAMPRADLRLSVADFTRASAAAVSAGVDLDAVATLRPEGAELKALARRGSVTIGRLQARLQPPGTAGGWTERLAAAPLSGGLRYNGPADLLPALAGLTDHQLAGPIGIAADFGGRLAEPQLAGLVRAKGLTYLNTVYGTRLTDLSLAGQFTNDRLEINRLTGKAGDGTVTAQGRIGLASAAGYPVDLTVDLDQARMARSDALGATATGRLRLTGPFTEGVLIAGELRLPEARYQVVRQGAAEIAVLEGVRRKGDPMPEPGAAAAERRRAAAAGLFRFDLRLRAPDQLFVSGMGLESEWGADLRIGGTSTAPAMTGTVNLVRGTYSFAGRRFDLDRASTLSFQGGTNPLIDIRANAEIDGLTVALVVTGRAQSPQIALTSTPSLPQDELLARVLFGESITNLSALQAVQLAAALNNLRGTGGGLNPLGKLRSAAGIDRLRILGEDQSTGRGAALAAGAYVSNDIYVEIITDARGFTATQIEVALSRALSILSQTSSFSGTSVELRYRRNY